MPHQQLACTVSARPTRFRRRVAALAFLPLALAVAPGLTSAQAPASTDPARVLATPGEVPLPFDSVRAGMLVRVHAPDLISGARTAVLRSRFGDTLLVRGLKHHELVGVPTPRIEWMEASTGRGWTAGSVAKGALIGTAAGVLFGAVLQNWSSKESDPSGCPFQFRSECGMKGTMFAIGLGVGILGGAGIGAEIGDERWRRVEVR